MNMTIYSTKSCGVCHALMTWLDGRDVAYRKVIVDEEERGMSELMAVSDGAIGVPFTVIEKGDQIYKIPGFDRRAFEQALA